MARIAPIALLGALDTWDSLAPGDQLLGNYILDSRNGIG